MQYPKLSTCQPADKMAAVLNEYIEGLAPATDALAPRLSLREHQLARGTDAYQEAASHYYHLHLLAVGLQCLHGAYIQAVAVLSDFADTHAGSIEAYQAERGSLRDALAPLFCNRTSTDERIGTANESLIYPVAEWNALATKLAKRLDLPGIPRLKFGQCKPKDNAYAIVGGVLREGQHLAAEFLAIEDSAGYLQLLSRLKRVQQVKGLSVQPK